MGQRLIEFYKQITNEMGITGKMELAKATKIPSIQAAIEPDTIEHIEKFKNAIEEIKNRKMQEAN